MYNIKSFVERPQEKKWPGYVLNMKFFQSLVNHRIYMTSGYECFAEGFFSYVFVSGLFASYIRLHGHRNQGGTGGNTCRRYAVTCSYPLPLDWLSKLVITPLPFTNFQFRKDKKKHCALGKIFRPNKSRIAQSCSFSTTFSLAREAPQTLSISFNFISQWFDMRTRWNTIATSTQN